MMIRTEHRCLIDVIFDNAGTVEAVELLGSGHAPAKLVIYPQA